MIILDRENSMNNKFRGFVFIALLLTVGFSAEAHQPAKTSKIGVLASSTPALNADRDEALRQGLRDLAYVEGKNTTLVFRYAEGKLDRLSSLAPELVQE